MMYLHAQLPLMGMLTIYTWNTHECKGEKANFQSQGIALMNQVLFCYSAMVE